MKQNEQIQHKVILIVEDDASVGACLVDIIAQETPYLAFLVTESHDALDTLKEVKPNMIILDYLLPHMNGLALYDYLQKHKPLRDIPVVMMSANLPRKEVEQRHLVVLHKPFEIDELLSTLQAQLDPVTKLTP